MMETKNRIMNCMISDKRDYAAGPLVLELKRCRQYTWGLKSCALAWEHLMGQILPYGVTSVYAGLSFRTLRSCCGI